MEIKIFDKYDISEVKVEDLGLQKYINLEPKLVLKSHGKIRGKLAKTKINIIERLGNQLAVPGHRRKKHRIITGWASGKYEKNMKAILKAFQIIEKKTGQNPIQVFIRAIGNTSPRDEITVIEYGGARYPQAVDVAPSRRVSLSLRWIIHGSYDKSFNKKTKIYEALADEILKASELNGESYAIQRKNESEKQADSAR